MKGTGKSREIEGRYIALDIHKEYVLAGGQNARQEWVMQTRRISADFPFRKKDGARNKMKTLRRRVLLKSPVREICTPGSVRGLLGNWQFYRDKKELYFTIHRQYCITQLK